MDPVVPLTPLTPSVGVAEKEGSDEAPWPVNTVPVVAAVTGVTAEVPSPTKTPWAVNVLAPVPPLATGKMPET